MKKIISILLVLLCLLVNMMTVAPVLAEDDPFADEEDTSEVIPEEEEETSEEEEELPEETDEEEPAPEEMPEEIPEEEPAEETGLYSLPEGFVSRKHDPEGRKTLNGMNILSEYDADLQALILSKPIKETRESRYMVLHSLFVPFDGENEYNGVPEYETSRLKFLGRGNSLRHADIIDSLYDLIIP